MCDLLKKSALAYQELSEYKYTLVCGRKGIQTQVEICFPIDAYHHLAGFQYSRIAALKERKNALSVVLSNGVSYAQLMASGFQHCDRLNCILRLQECLDANRFVFRYNGHEHPHSKIRADYLMVFEDSVFFTCGDTPISIFKNTSFDYQRNCPRMTVLQIRRTHLKIGEEFVVYQREGYTE